MCARALGFGFWGSPQLTRCGEISLVVSYSIVTGRPDNPLALQHVHYQSHYLLLRLWLIPASEQ